MQSLTEMNKLLRGRREGYDVNRTFNIEHEINNFRNQLKSQNINDVNNHEYTYAVVPSIWISLMSVRSLVTMLSTSLRPEWD